MPKIERQDSENLLDEPFFIPYCEEISKKEYVKRNRLLGWKRRRYDAEVGLLKKILNETNDDTRKDFEGALERALQERLKSRNSLVELNLKLIPGFAYKLGKVIDKKLDEVDLAEAAGDVLMKCAEAWQPDGNAGFPRYFYNSLERKIWKLSRKRVREEMRKEKLIEYMTYQGKIQRRDGKTKFLLREEGFSENQIYEMDRKYMRESINGVIRDLERVPHNSLVIKFGFEGPLRTKSGSVLKGLPSARHRENSMKRILKRLRENPQIVNVAKVMGVID